MREILFRGKRSDTGEWIEGYFGQSVDSFIIQDYGLVAGHFQVFKVIPETLSQYTGMADKNGRKIFERDLLKDSNGFIYEVYFDGGCFMIKYGLRSNTFATTHQILEVVGNIYDNPELLEVKHDGN